jgi:hypothetical protein
MVIGREEGAQALKGREGTSKRKKSYLWICNVLLKNLKRRSKRHNPPRFVEVIPRSMLNTLY